MLTIDYPSERYAPRGEGRGAEGRHRSHVWPLPGQAAPPAGRGPWLERVLIPPDDLDPTDESILDEIRKMFSVLDPVPETLVERVQFALDVETADAEVLRLREEAGLRAAARGGEESRTITFEGDDLTIMISVRVQTQRLSGLCVPRMRAPLRIRRRSTTGRPGCIRMGWVCLPTGDQRRYGPRRVRLPAYRG
ncbi:hypothetical protein AB0L53_30400 [Nonomuraea sp. NPDC052129]|uniref:hypothetical protein n=1 Tax=Nonomuraea sp. NPDC052129 TaxID=3154651 RepID=UPI0034161936